MSTKLTREQAAQAELDRRERRRDLTKWAEFFLKDFGQAPAQHHRMLLDKLQAVTDGSLVHPTSGDPCRNLVVLMPPGSAKSTYISVTFPPWYLQRKPASRILACSATSDLIESFSRQCRNAVDMHTRELGISLMADSRAVQEWHVSNGGTYRCAGVGSGITGRRAYLGFIDDYLASQEDADSKLIRDKQWLWYWGDFWPRLIPGAPQIIVANRRHEEDLVGRLLEKQEKSWCVISLPFFAEQNDPLGRLEGSVLWPEWFNPDKVKEVEQLRAELPRIFAGLYQQRPAPEEGDYFKKDWLRTYTQEEYDALMRTQPRIYGAGDWAVSEKKEANRNCLGCVAMDSEGTLFVLPDLFWKQSGPKETVASFVDLLKRRNPLVFWSEKGHISQSLGPFIRERMLEEQVYSYISEVSPTRDKETRAQSIRGRMSMLKVRFPAFAHWWPAAMHELLMFPGGKTDDFVDFLAHVGMGINSMVKTALPAPQRDESLVPSEPITLNWVKKSHKDRFNTTRYQGR